MDTWVKNSQQWVNAHYGSNSSYLPVPEDGITGWPTMYSLTIALQIELGITAPVKTFGPATLAALTKIGDIGATTTNKNLVALVQCALWCKGYWGDTTFGTWTTKISTAVASLRSDMGLPANTVVSPKMFKSLLTMDAYVTLAGGSSAVSGVQRWMNGRYFGRADFYFVPCDGIYSRGVQQGLMYAIQYEIGLADGVATGAFGPKTQDGLKTQGNIVEGSKDGNQSFVHLFQAALTFNGYASAFDGNFSSQVTTLTKSFQAFAALPVTGRGDYSTWASLLVSYGDTTRQGVLADTTATLSAARAASLKSLGYRAAGRYIVNFPGDPTKESITNKKLQPGELSSIISQGLAVVPIYQPGNDAKEYFSTEQGKQAGIHAAAVAAAYGFPTGTTIYFAVDFDAVADQVLSNVVPYFNGVVNGLASAGGLYKCGVYGARNTCTLVTSGTSGGVTKSFVSDMSSGYSGNLGFALPSNWAWDQILEYTVSSGSDSFGVDKSVSSGKDSGITSVRSPVLFSDYITWLYARSGERTSADASSTQNRRVTEWLRRNQYTDGFNSVLGNPDQGYINYVNSFSREEVFGLSPDVDNIYIHGSHFGVGVAGVLMYGLPSNLADTNRADIVGWGGDLVSVAHAYLLALQAGMASSAYDYARLFIASTNGPYDIHDWNEDIDGIIVGAQIGQRGLASIADKTNAYYAVGGASYSRNASFYQIRFGASWTNVKGAAVGIFTNADVSIVAIRAAVYAGSYDGSNAATRDPTSAEIDAIATAFVDVLKTKV